MYQLIYINLRRTFKALLLLIITSLTAFGQSQQRIDSLKELLERANTEESINIRMALFREYLSSDPETALGYANKALESAIKVRDSLNIVKASNGRGWILKNKGELREAIRTFESALFIARHNHYEDQVKYLLNNLALSYTGTAQYDKALDYNFESLKIREAENDPSEVSVANNNIGLVYHELGDLENALKYYERSYDIKVNKNVKFDLERTLINIGLVLNGLGKYNLAEAKLKEVFAICETGECRPDILVEAYQALGIAQVNQDEYVAAESNFKKTRDLSQRIGLPEYTATSFYWLGELRYRQKRMGEAIGFLDNSLEIATKTAYRKVTLENYSLYSKIYSYNGDYRKASYFQDLYIKLYGQIFNADLIRNISSVQEQENIKTIEEKNYILALNEEVIAQQKLQNWLLIAVILLTSVLVIVIFRNYQRIKVVNSELATAKKMIEVQNKFLDQQVQEKTKELVDTNEALVKVNDELDNFIYKTSHDIRGPLASLKGMVNLAIMDVHDDKALGYLEKLDLTAEKLNVVLTRLLIVNRINHAELKPEAIHFEPIIQDILTLEMKKGVPSKIRLEYEVAADIQLTSDREMVRLILENLIDNALKFYNDSERVTSFVRIVVRGEEGQITAHVMDNGVGISQMNREKIFQMFVRASERSETGGIGLYLAKLATEKLGGEINLFSTDEKYTEFIVRFPRDLQGIIERRKEEKRRLEEERMQLLRERASQPVRGFVQG